MKKLQQELFDLMVKKIEADDFLYDFIVGNMQWEEAKSALEKDISTMDAVDLRKNIRIWKSDNF